MSIQEYAVNDDFFQFESHSGEFDFPCCCCKFKNTAAKDYPCKFCGHNINAIERHKCVACGNLQEGNSYVDGKYIAPGTSAEIGPLCSKCYKTIINSVKGKEK